MVGLRRWGFLCLAVACAIGCAGCTAISPPSPAVLSAFNDQLHLSYPATWSSWTGTVPRSGRTLVAIISDSRADPRCSLCDASEMARVTVWLIGDPGGTIAQAVGDSPDRIGRMPVLIEHIAPDAPGRSLNVDTTYWTFALPAAPKQYYQVISQVRGPDAATLAEVVVLIVSSAR